MSLDGEYEPSPAAWVRDQVAAYEASGGREANTLRETGLPVVVADDPLTCVARGGGRILELMDELGPGHFGLE